MTDPPLREIRARYDRDGIVVYQAYAPAVAEPALRAQRFVPPFSFERMTWIKPSFLWMMHRSAWGTRAGQERVLAVRLRRDAWDGALAQGVLTSPERGSGLQGVAWEEAFAAAKVHVQWDPERTLRGAARSCYAIQVGISRALVRDYAERWILGIEDVTPLVRKAADKLRSGRAAEATALLPREATYPVDPAVGRRLLIDAGRG